MRNILTKKNSKMGDNVYLFNLPALKTCHPTPWCRQNCYALKGNFRFPSVIQSYEQRYKISRLPDFAVRVAAEIKRRRVRLVRMHASGDFYDKNYVQKWIEIARQSPDTLFRASTKRLDLISAIYELNNLPNCIIRESVDPTRPKAASDLALSAVDITPGVDELLKTKQMVRCIDSCKKCDYHCWKNQVHICFSPH